MQTFYDKSNAMKDALGETMIHKNCDANNLYELRYFISFFNFQSPRSGPKISKRQSENPTLLDNWDDAEGYYRKFDYFIFLNY